MSRANDPAIQNLLLHARQINIQNPEYAEIKKILEEGVDGRYKNTPEEYDHLHEENKYGVCRVCAQRKVGLDKTANQ